MKSLFDDAARQEILRRISSLTADSPRQWGKMNSGQMLGHCSAALETGTGDRRMKQRLLGRIVTPLIRSSIFGEKPFGRNAPTDPTFVVADVRDFERERSRLVDLIQRFTSRGPAGASQEMHPFFGRLSGEEWGCLMHKHIDHHLQQFGV